jgi:hypothetical protein
VLIDGALPWENIQPRAGRGGAAPANLSGKYAVRVFHQDEWRCLVVDDLVPVDANGVCLFPTTTSALEIWPWIVSKAVLKLWPGYAALPVALARIVYQFCCKE